MDKIKHTPGPWVVGEVCNDMMHPDCQGGEFRTIDAPGAHHSALAVVVTRMMDDDGHNDDLGGSDLCRGDAVLIAAAPALLQALKRVLGDNCPLTGNPSRKELREHWEYEKSQGNGAADAMLLAHAAVAKAEGETP